MRKTDLKTIYFNIYMTYINSYTTLEEVGRKHDISKQRVWQIVRFCRLGEGNYYTGLKLYNETYKSYQEEFAKADSKTLNALMRDWMKLKNIRLIKIK
tara:strand:- start:343 stop:636 length:294 start_codon:yes stop_codon:yes gene_type:complete